nr:MAG TPA: hypothetical protein [Caudoviricetes sp.]
MQSVSIHRQGARSDYLVPCPCVHPALSADSVWMYTKTV